jgi:aerobic-type carbon monoxide dehydrogenase small subunit (CoxS/CutS family)
MESYESIIELKVNGNTEKTAVKNNWTLLKVLRDKLILTGTKCGCNKGECGACTVLMNGKAVLSCLTLAVAADKQEILTIEGLTED